MRLRLTGTFQLLDDQGGNCTPRGAKARAIIAMLCRIPERCRSRRWLESKLWSDRAPEQASGSLRQALMEIRQALGHHSSLLVTDRDTVTLSGVVTDLDTERDRVREALAEGRDFLEGIDIEDEAFEDWLRNERALLSDQAVPGKAMAGVLAEPMPFVVRLGGFSSGIAGFVGAAMAEAIGSLMMDFAEVEVYSDAQGTAIVSAPTRGITLAIEVAALGAQLHVLVALASTANQRILWSRRVTLVTDAADLIGEGAFPQIVFNAAEAAHAAVANIPAPDGRFWADAMTARAVQAMYSFDAAQLATADRLLAESLKFRPTARAWAWRGQLRQIMAVERTDLDWLKLREEADEYARRAMEMPEGNPLVYALVSQVRVMLDADPEVGTKLAQDAVVLSPYNAHGQAALAGAQLRAGAYAAALDAATAGARLAANSPHAFWWDSLVGLSALANGDVKLAIHHYEAAHFRSPNFRSPLRHLYFLYLVGGQPDRADRILQALRRLEPDFSIDRVRYDEHYPAATLRRTKLAEMAMQRL